ncbi:MAG: family 20 glycosylhydrolase [Eubacteriales bacterium]|nr:family 20 glycosylhydrolase [Eubacteriales bacterium]
MKEIFLLPVPQSIKFNAGFFRFTGNQTIDFRAEERRAVFSACKRLQRIIKDEINLKLEICENNNPEECRGLAFVKNSVLSDEGYYIKIRSTGIEIGYSDPAGGFYAVSSLKQILRQCKKELPCMEISDRPDFRHRGIMLDVSRNKIPKMETLFSLIDFMADMKLNQLQLYFEGFSFEYRSFPDVTAGGTPIIGEQIIELDSYCRDQFIELVPNQNSFGHMEAWLARDEFKKLAESEEGFIDSNGVLRPAGTLNPSDPKTLELVGKMYDDFLPYFTSKSFNVGCDETFELGKGKSREECEKHGTGRIYLNYLLKIYSSVKDRQKKMMFWGDIIIQHPEQINDLPKDAIALEWGYEADHPFKENLSKYKNAGIPFYVCPGTSSWNSISGRYDNMKGNLVNAAVNGKRYGAEGYLITDWGDNGHLQYQPFSYPGYVYGACLSWNVKDNIDADISIYLDEFVFMDKNRVTTQNMKDLGNYYLVEKHKIFNYTSLAKSLFSGLDESEIPEFLDRQVAQAIEDYVNNIVKRLDFAKMDCPDAELIDEELRNTCNLILHGTKLVKLKINLRQKNPNEISEEVLTEMIGDISRIIEKHTELWLRRNRQGGLEESNMILKRLKNQYRSILSKLKK